MSVLVESECRVWTGARDPKGYGRVTIDGRSMQVHRVTYAFYNGPIPDGYVVMHSCDNPPCMNPEHLRLGTQADNLADMWGKGRGKGNANTNGVCRNGLHVWKPENIYTASDGWQRCRPCKRDRDRLNKQQHRATKEN